VPVPEPSSAVPAETRRGTRIAVAAGVSLAVLLIGVAGFVVSSPSISVPSDYRAYLNRTDEPILVVESADRVPPMTLTVSTTGVLGTLASLPNDEASLFLVALGADATDPTVQIERSLSTEVDAYGAVLATTTLSLMRSDGYFTVLSLASNGQTFLYAPPRKELPSDPVPGANWTDTGEVNLTTPFVYRGSIDAAPTQSGRRCIAVTTILDQQDSAGGPMNDTTDSTWCEGLGSIRATSRASGLTFALAEPGSVRLGEVTPPSAASLPEGTVIPSSFSNTGLSLAPVVIDGLVVSTNGPIGDLIAVHPSIVDGVPTQSTTWIQHPGGEVVGIGEADGRMAVTTTRRALMGFDAAGRIHWLQRLPDVSVGRPAILDGIVAVSLMDGTVRAYDIRSGHQRWTIRLDDTFATAPIVSGSLVVAADTSGRIEATHSDGSPTWTAETEGVFAPMTSTGDGGVILQDGTGALHRFDRRGTRSWTANVDTSVTDSGVVVGSVAMLPTKDGVVGFRLSGGEEVWRIRDLEQPHLTDGGLVAAGPTVGRITEGGTLHRLATLTSSSEANLAQTWVHTMGAHILAIDKSGVITVVQGE